MLTAGVIHGDLSEFNILLAADGPVIIDLPQAVDAAEGYAARATDATRVQYEAVTDRVRERPGQSLLIAAGVGYILARILGR